MPELPEVETVRRGLDAAITGQAVADVEIRDARLTLRSPLDPVTVLPGACVAAVRRRGKWLFVDLDTGICMVLHLRMSGQLLTGPTEPGDVRPVRALLRFGDGTTRLRFVDQRRFGELLVFTAEGADTLETHIGPDAHTIDVRRLRHALRGRTGRLKAALTNQSILGGIGNIYADESLWLARLAPDRPAGSLDDTELRCLARSIRDVMRASLKAGGTSARDGLYVGTGGEPGWFHLELAVYQREGEPCRRCRTPIVRVRAGATSTRYCPSCQA